MMDMFTGIISHLGKLQKVNQNVYAFSAPFEFCKRIKKGTSVAINGVCLTVCQKPTSNSFSVEIMPETLKKTMLVKLKLNDLVNLEFPASLHTFLSGHLVQGHIDGIGTVTNIKTEGNSRLLTIRIPLKLSKYIVEKGSIAINGISLTVIKAGKNYLTVGIIPYTWQHTMLRKIAINELVNLEVDILAKYLEKLIRKRNS